MTSNRARYPSLNGKAVYITGGATGIGAALVEAFAGQGARVAFADIAQGEGEALCARVQEATGQPPRFHCIDVTQTDELQDSIRQAREQFGNLNVLVNNVANDMRHDPLKTGPEEWRNYLAINLDAAFFASQEAIRIMRENDGGVLVTISSINALLGPPGMPAYVAAKSALLGLTRSLAREYGVEGIRANTIIPGWIATERQLATWLTPEEERAWTEQMALKGRIQPEEVASLALFLAADDSAKITAQHFVIDGGRI